MAADQSQSALDRPPWTAPVEQDEYRQARQKVTVKPEFTEYPDPDVRVEVRVEIRGVGRESSMELPHDTVADSDLPGIAERVLDRVAEAARGMIAELDESGSDE